MEFFLEGNPRKKIQETSDISDIIGYGMKIEIVAQSSHAGLCGKSVC